MLSLINAFVNFWLNLQRKLNDRQIIIVSFLLLILCGTFILMLPIANQKGEWMNFIDALFTATSATCVTGLVVEDTGTYFSWFGHLIIIILIQLGGLGLMTLTTMLVILVGKKIGLKDRLALQESFNQGQTAGVVKLARKIAEYAFYTEFGFGTIMAIAFYPEMGLKGIFFGYWHAVSAFCNAGFDLMGNYASFMDYQNNYLINICIMLLIIIGGLGFTVIDELLYFSGRSKVTLHSKIVIMTSLWLIVSGALLLWIFEANNLTTLGGLSDGEGALAALFQAVSARTAGFNSVELNGLTDGGILVLIMLMFIGASPASTGGGIKTTTFAVLIYATVAFMRGRKEVVLFNRSVEPEVVNKAMTVAVLYFGWALIATLLLLALNDAGHPFKFVVFEVVSALATVGMGIGITHDWNALAKLILIFTMLVGRIGVLTFALSFLKNSNTKVKYPSEHINIG